MCNCFVLANSLRAIHLPSTTVVHRIMLYILMNEIMGKGILRNNVENMNMKMKPSWSSARFLLRLYFEENVNNVAIRYFYFYKSV